MLLGDFVVHWERSLPGKSFRNLLKLQIGKEDSQTSAEKPMECRVAELLLAQRWVLPIGGEVEQKNEPEGARKKRKRPHDGGPLEMWNISGRGAPRNRFTEGRLKERSRSEGGKGMT